MDRLILFRHGEAEHDAASGDDFDRPLNAQGRAESAATARLLAVSGAAPDLALVSSAVRTVQTFEAIRFLFPRAAARTSRTLYLASARELMTAVREAAAEGVASLMVVAHNPGIHELALALAREGSGSGADLGVLEQKFPTAAAAVFGFSVEGGPRLEALHLPRADRA